MPVTVKPITLWRSEIADRPGAMAQVLEPLAAAKADLSVCMGYRIPGEKGHAVVELYPITGKKQAEAARAGGLQPSGIPTLHVSGDDRPGLGHALAKAVAAAGINMTFMVAQVAGRKYSAVVGFDSDADAKKASGVIRKAAARK
jgi:hypothetical protein